MTSAKSEMRQIRSSIKVDRMKKKQRERQQKSSELRLKKM